MAKVVLTRTGTKVLKTSRTEGLLELDRVRLAALALAEALQSNHFDKFPTHPATWDSYFAHHRLVRWSHVSVVGLLALTIFETPSWCRASTVNFFDFRSSQEVCADALGLPSSELIMSGVPLLPLGLSLTIEYIMLTIILVRIQVSAQLHRLFRNVGGGYRTNGAMILDYLMILLGFCDAFYFSFFPKAKGRIAPFVRFGLAVSIPWIKRVVASFAMVSRSVVTVGVCLLATIFVFAWLMAMILDDWNEPDAYGEPINKGFTNFGDSLYTMFVTMTTANLPDVMVSSYAHSRLFLLFWIPFFVLAVCVFTQVILATVYNEYGDEVTEQEKRRHRHRMMGMEVAFRHLKADVAHNKNGKEVDVVSFETFTELVDVFRPFNRYVVEKKFIRVCFEALDADKSEALSFSEFQDMCVVLQTRFSVTERDSAVRKWLEGSPAGRTLEWWMTNGKEGPDLGTSPPAWLPSKFDGSPFCKLMSFVLLCNVGWVVVQSLYDLNDIPELWFFQYLDLLFSFVYLIEVVVKLCWWSWREYWRSADNKFDFMTTAILASAGIAFLFFNFSNNLMRYFNLLRLLRLLKALKNVKMYEKTVLTIARMVSTCGDVLVMNLLMIYIWGAAGVQLFGGQLYKNNPVLKGAGEDVMQYFGDHLLVFNFDDMVMAMMTMFLVTITSWNDQIARVCIATYNSHSVGGFVSMAFWVSFYIASPLIAFNVFTAFSIDVYCHLERVGAEENTKTTIEENLESLQAKMANEGLCLAIEESAELAREKVYRAMFLDEDDDDDENGG